MQVRNKVIGRRGTNVKLALQRPMRDPWVPFPHESSDGMLDLCCSLHVLVCVGTSLLHTHTHTQVVSSQPECPKAHTGSSSILQLHASKECTDLHACVCTRIVCKHIHTHIHTYTCTRTRRSGNEILSHVFELTLPREPPKSLVDPSHQPVCNVLARTHTCVCLRALSDQVCFDTSGVFQSLVPCQSACSLVCMHVGVCTCVVYGIWASECLPSTVARHQKICASHAACSSWSLIIL